MVNNKKKIRIVVGDVEFVVTAPAVKTQVMEDLIFDLGGSAICSGNFTLSAEQYVDFANKSIHVLTN